MSLSAIDAMLRERRLAAMRAEVEQSFYAPPPEGQPGRGDNPNQLLLEGQSDDDPWTSTGAAPGTEFTAAEPPDALPMSPPTMNVAAGGLANPYPSRSLTGGYRDVENCARGHVSQRCGGNRFDDTPRRRK